MKIKPLGTYVLIKPDLEEDVTKSGIVISTANDKKEKSYGEIIALGSDDGDYHLNVGDRVYFEKWGGEDIEIEKEKFKLIDYTKILALVTE